jgi:hypothetical protein
MSDLSDSLLHGGMILPTGNVAKKVPFGEILFLTNVMLYKGINKRVGRFYFCDCLFPKNDLS